MIVAAVELARSLARSLTQSTCLLRSGFIRPLGRQKETLPFFFNRGGFFCCVCESIFMLVEPGILRGVSSWGAGLLRMASPSSALCLSLTPLKNCAQIGAIQGRLCEGMGAVGEAPARGHAGEFGPPQFHPGLSACSSAVPLLRLWCFLPICSWLSVEAL